MRSRRPNSSSPPTRSRASRSPTCPSVCSGTACRGSGSARTGGKEPPLARHALQLAHSLFLELDPRARDQVFDGARNENLTGAGRSGYASSGVDGNSRHLSVLQLALACVDASPDREVELTDRPDDCARARNRPCGTVEDRKELVARRIKLLAAKARQLAADQCVVILHEIAPGSVADHRRPAAAMTFFRVWTTGRRDAEHRHEDEIARPIPERLVCDRNIAASHVLDLGNFHAGKCPTRLIAWPHCDRAARAVSRLYRRRPPPPGPRARDRPCRSGPIARATRPRARSNLLPSRG